MTPIWFLLYIPLGLIIYGAIIITFYKKFRMEDEESEDVIEFVVLDEEDEMYKNFMTWTYNLKGIREDSKFSELTDDKRKEIMGVLDENIADIQDELMYMNTDGLPNPDLVTKRYIQSLIVKTFAVRINFERLSGYSEPNADSGEGTVLKLVQSHSKEQGKNKK